MKKKSKSILDLPKFQRLLVKNKRTNIVHGDSLEYTSILPSESIDLTITSPPYCMGKAYEKGKQLDAFIESHQRLLPQIERVTKNGGSVCWQVGYHLNKGVVTPLDFLIHEIISKTTSLVLRDRIIWTFGHGLHATTKFSGRHEVILWYSKGSYEFDLDAVRVEQKYPGKRSYKGSRKGEFSGNPLGKNPSNVWNFPNVKGGHVEKTEHPCQFPVALAERLIKALSPPTGVIYDPFLGSGTTAVAAHINGRNFVGCEIDEKYFEISKARISGLATGVTKYRPLEKDLYEPIPGSKLTVNPFK